MNEPRPRASKFRWLAIHACGALFVCGACNACNASGSSGSSGSSDPPNRPVDICTSSCSDKAARQCSRDECNRGCQFILDRLAEGEGDHVIKCVAARDTRCGDPVWADCATRIGIHTDGGPPAPPPPKDEWE